MSENRRDEFIRRIFTITAPYIDYLTSLFSLGLCHLWRRKAVALAGLKEKDRVLDVCTGTGEMAFAILKNKVWSGSLVGVDFCPKMIEIARQKLKKASNPHPKDVTFVIGDAKSLEFPDNSFDLVTVGFGMRNIPDTTAALREIYRVLKPGGRFICLELTRPKARWFLPFYKWYVFKIMPRIGRLVVKKAAPYIYLPRSIEAFYPPLEFSRIIMECGFTNVTVLPMTLGVAAIFTAAKPLADHK